MHSRTKNRAPERGNAGFGMEFWVVMGLVSVLVFCFLAGCENKSSSLKPNGSSNFPSSLTPRERSEQLKRNFPPSAARFQLNSELQTLLEDFAANDEQGRESAALFSVYLNACNASDRAQDELALLRIASRSWRKHPTKPALLYFRVLYAQALLRDGNARSALDVSRSTIQILDSMKLAGWANSAAAAHARLLHYMNRTPEARQFIAERMQLPADDADKVPLRLLSLELSFVGEPADLAGPRLGGGTIHISSMKGKVVLIDFWGSWCPFCVAEFPLLKKLYQKYKGLGLEILGVNFTDEDTAAVEKVVQRDSITWPQLFYPPGQVAEGTLKYPISGFPHHIIVDKRGRNVYMNIDNSRMFEYLIKRELVK